MNRLTSGATLRSIRTLSSLPSVVMNSTTSTRASLSNSPALRPFSSVNAFSIRSSVPASSFHSSSLIRVEESSKSSASPSSSSPSSSSSASSQSGASYRVVSTSGFASDSEQNPETERRIMMTFVAIGVAGLMIYFYGTVAYPVEEIKNWNGALAQGEKQAKTN